MTATNINTLLVLSLFIIVTSGCAIRKARLDNSEPEIAVVVISILLAIWGVISVCCFVDGLVK